MLFISELLWNKKSQDSLKIIIQSNMTHHQKILNLITEWYTFHMVSSHGQRERYISPYHRKHFTFIFHKCSDCPWNIIQILNFGLFVKLRHFQFCQLSRLQYSRAITKFLTMLIQIHSYANKLPVDHDIYKLLRQHEIKNWNYFPDPFNLRKEKGPK